MNTDPTPTGQTPTITVRRRRRAAPRRGPPAPGAPGRSARISPTTGSAAHPHEPRTLRRGLRGELAPAAARRGPGSPAPPWIVPAAAARRRGPRGDRHRLRAQRRSPAHDATGRRGTPTAVATLDPAGVVPPTPSERTVERPTQTATGRPPLPSDHRRPASDDHADRARYRLARRCRQRPAALSGSSSPPRSRHPDRPRTRRWPPSGWRSARHRLAPPTLRVDRVDRRVGDGRDGLRSPCALVGHDGTHPLAAAAARAGPSRPRSGTALPVRFELADGGTAGSPGPPGVDALHPAEPTRWRCSTRSRRSGSTSPRGLGRRGRRPPHRQGRRQHVRGERRVAAAPRGRQAVDSGFTTASRGAPARGTYTFPTKQSLTAGAYVLRVFASSANDGSRSAEQRRPLHRALTRAPT